MNTFKKYIVEDYLGLTYQDDTSYSNNKLALKSKLYSELISKDPSRVLVASKIVRSCDDLNFSKEELAIIISATSELPESNICRMFDYRLDVQEGIEVIKHFVDGNLCKCGLYEKYERISPESQIAMGLVNLVGKPYVNLEKYQHEYDLVCSTCDTKWFTFEQHSYHYPWSKWKKVEA